MTRTERAVEGPRAGTPRDSAWPHGLGPFDYDKESAAVQESVGFEFSKSVRVVNADGTCPTTILSRLDSIRFVTIWQPGDSGSASIGC